jgi:peptidoglycan-N-acetylglucosamine deacetylase
MISRSISTAKAAIILPALVCFFSCNNAPAPAKEKQDADTIAAKKEMPGKWMPVLDSAKKTIYLTFDDGPNFGSTIVMNIAKQENIPVSFFTIGTHVYGSPLQMKLWKEMHENKLFEICNHSYTHGFNNRYASFYAQPAAVVQDFNRNNDSCHFNNKIIRTPGNDVWRLPNIQSSTKMARIAADSLYKAGYLAMGWDWEWEYRYRDLKLKQTAAQLYSEIETVFNGTQIKMPNHLVLLAHDLTFRDAADSTELHSFVKMLKANPGYQLAFASQYPGLK